MRSRKLAETETETERAIATGTGTATETTVGTATETATGTGTGRAIGPGTAATTRTAARVARASGRLEGSAKGIRSAGAEADAGTRAGAGVAAIAKGRPVGGTRTRGRPGANRFVPLNDGPAGGTRVRARSGANRFVPAKGDRERGSATVLAAGVAVALVVTAVGFIAVGQASAARHRAQGAADAAALAGAARVLFGEGEACGAARAMVERAGSELERCEVGDMEVTVHVSEVPAGIPAAFGPARAVSRAGPVTVA
jgi:secretion/DNA translocation related TadE-like protein